MNASKKNRNSLIKLLDQLYSLALWDWEHTSALSAPSFSDCDIGSGNIAFSGCRSLARLAETVEMLHASLPARSAYSEDYIRKSLLHWLRECRTNGTPPDAQTVASLLERLQTTAALEQRVFRAVYGAALDNSPHPVSIGPCTFYCLRTHGDFLSTQALFTEEAHQWIRGVDVLAEVKVTAVDAKAAYTSADSTFSTVESLIMLTAPQDRDYQRVAIVSEHASYWRPSLVLRGASVQLSAENLGPTEPLPLDSTAFLSPETAMARLWTILNADCRSKWENRLLRGAEWLGSALASRDTDAAVVRTATALETLLYVDTQQPYAASRTAVLSEAAAHIIGTSVSHCLRVEEEVKSLYKARSRIVHNGDAGLTRTHLAKLMKLARNVLFQLLVGTTWQDIQSPEGLRDELLRARYANHCS